MTKQRADAGYHRLYANYEFLELGCRAIFLTSISQSRFVHLRDAVADGLQRLMRRDRSYVRASALRYQRSAYQGDHLIILTFTENDRALLEDLRAELRTLTGAKCTYFDAVVLALHECAEANVAGETNAFPTIPKK